MDVNLWSQQFNQNNLNNPHLDPHHNYLPQYLLQLKAPLARQPYRNPRLQDQLPLGLQPHLARQACLNLQLHPGFQPRLAHQPCLNLQLPQGLQSHPGFQPRLAHQACLNLQLPQGLQSHLARQPCLNPRLPLGLQPHPGFQPRLALQLCLNPHLRPQQNHQILPPRHHRHQTPLKHALPLLLHHYLRQSRLLHLPHSQTGTTLHYTTLLTTTNSPL
jgi:hypothetical protein